MRRWIIRELLRPATIIALVALVVASTGTAYATGLIGPGQIQRDAIYGSHIRAGAVESSELRNLAVKSIDLDRASVNSSKIRNGSVRAEDLASDAVTGSALSAGAVTGSAVADGSLTAADFASTAQPPRGFVTPLLAVDDAPHVIGTWNGFRVRAQCRNAGDRTAAVMIDNGGATDWGVVGTTMWDPTPGDPAGVVPEVPIGGGVANFEVSAKESDAQAQAFTLYVGKGDGSAAMFIHFVASNAAGGGDRCLVGGYGVAISPE